jgi:hypothetical protein
MLKRVLFIGFLLPFTLYTISYFTEHCTMFAAPNTRANFAAPISPRQFQIQLILFPLNQLQLQLQLQRTREQEQRSISLSAGTTPIVQFHIAKERHTIINFTLPRNSVHRSNTRCTGTLGLINFNLLRNDGYCSMFLVLGSTFNVLRNDVLFSTPI